MDVEIASQSLATFTLFSELPSELRLKIWGYILRQPRLIKVRRSPDHWRNPYASSGWTAYKTPLPVSLHICHESRKEALKSYQLAFGSPFCSSKIYIDFSVDTIRFGDGPSLEDTQKLGKWTDPYDYNLDVFLGGGPHGAEDYEKVESMILDISESIYDRRNFCWDEVRLFSGLKELTMLVWEPDYVMGQMMAKYRDTLGRVKRAHPEWIVPKIDVIGMESGADWGILEAPAIREIDEESV